eukprot:4949735-Prymnesium_polylepis.4
MENLVGSCVSICWMFLPLPSILVTNCGARLSDGDALATMCFEGVPSKRRADCCGKSEQRSLTIVVAGCSDASVPPYR